MDVQIACQPIGPEPVLRWTATDTVGAKAPIRIARQASHEASDLKQPERSIL